MSQVTSCDLEVQPLTADRQILECFPVLLQREKLFVLLFESAQNVGVLHRLDFQFLPKSAVRSFVKTYEEMVLLSGQFSVLGT